MLQLLLCTLPIELLHLLYCLHYYTVLVVQHDAIDEVQCCIALYPDHALYEFILRY